MTHPVYNKFLVGIFVVMMVPAADAATLAREVNTANELYGQGKFEDALTHYQKALAKDPRSALIQFNLGTAHYKKGGYAQSIEHLQNALLADEPELQQKARYNLGNALYKQGISKEGSDLSGAIADLERSLGHFEKNLTAIPKDADNQSNFEFVKSELQRLKQKEQQQKQENKSEKSQDKDQQKKDQQDQKQEQAAQDDKSQKDPSQDPGNDNEKSDDKKDGSGQDDQKKDDNKKDNGKPQDKQDNADQPPRDNSSDGSSGGQPQDQASDKTQGKEQGMMTPQEAQMLLDDYQRNDEPKGMLYFKPQSDNSDSVIKDW